MGLESILLQLFITLNYERGLIHRQSEQGFVLKDDVKYIWENADGLKFAAELRKINPEIYDEMIDSGLIKEIDL